MNNTPQNNFKTVAVFSDHLVEMLETASDRSELLKRHGDSLIRLHDSLTELLGKREESL